MATSDSQKLRPLASPIAGADPQIGTLLVRQGKLTVEDAERVLRLQREQGLRFGDAAVKLGLISEEDLRHVLASQYDYPYLRTEESGIGRELSAAYRPFTRQVEQFRALRSHLMLRWFNSEHKALAVVSPARGDGRSFLAANLAVVCSQLGQKTLLLDADMRHARQHSYFGLDNRSGLSTVLSGRAAEEPIKRVPVFMDLSILPSGPTPPNPQELLTRPQFTRLLHDLGQRYDVVLIDTPSSDASADAQAVAVRAGAALVVARRNRSRVKALQALCSMVVDSGGRVVGTVLNNF